MTPIVVVAILIASVWGAVYLARGSMLAGCLAVLIVGYCLGHPYFSVDVGPIPLTLDRLLLVGLVVCYMVKRCLGHLDPKPLLAVDFLLLGFVALLTVIALMGLYDTTFETDRSSVGLLVASYLIPLTLYWIARQASITERGLKWLMGGFTALGIYLAVTALAEIGQ